MKNCPVCGKPMEDEELFCGSCGAKYEEPVQVQETGAEGGFCPSCGTRVEAGTVFCPNCGTNVTTGAPAGGVKPKAAIPKAAGFAVAGVAAVAVLALVINLLMGVFATPADKFLSIQKKVLQEQVLGTISAVADKYNNTKEFSTDLTLSASAKDATLRELLDGSEITLKLDLSEKAQLINGSVTVMGEDLVSAILTYEKDKLGICIPEADPNYYVIGTKALYELMGVDEDQVEAYSHVKKPTYPTDKVNKLAAAYWSIVTSTVTKDNTTKSDKEQFKLDELNEKLDGELYVFKPTAEDVEEMLLKLADKLEKDKELRKVVLDFVKENRDTLESALTDSGYDLDDLEDDMDKALAELVDQLRDNAENIGKAVEQAKFKWSVGVSKGEVCLEKIEFSGGALVYESTGEKRVFYVMEDGEKEFILRVECKEKDGLLRGSVSCTSYSYSYYYGNYEETISLEFKNVDKKKTSILGIPYGSYSLSADGEELKLDVKKGEKGGTDHTLSLSETYVSGVGYVQGLSVTLNTSDKKSTAAKPKGKTVDISGYDMEEVQELVTTIGNELEDIFSKVAGQTTRNNSNYTQPNGSGDCDVPDSPNSGDWG